MTKFITYGIALAFAMLLLAGCGNNNGVDLADPVNRVVAALENHRFAEAAATFGRDIDEDTADRLEQAMRSRLTALRSGFMDGNISHEMASRELSTIAGFGFEELTPELNELEDFINRIYASRNAFNMAEALLGAGDNFNAILQYDLVIRDDPNFAEAQEGRGRAVDRHRRAILSDAGELVEDNNIPAAMSILDAALIFIENDPEILAFRNNLIDRGRDERLDGIRAMAEAGGYRAAASELQAMMAQNPADAGVRVALFEIEESHARAIAEEVDALLEAGRYQEAAVVAESGLWLYPGNTALILAHENARRLAEQGDIAAQGLVMEAAALASAGLYEDAVSLLSDSPYAEHPRVAEAIEDYLTRLLIHDILAELDSLDDLDLSELGLSELGFSDFEHMDFDEYLIAELLRYPESAQYVETPEPPDFTAIPIVPADDALENMPDFPGAMSRGSRGNNVRLLQAYLNAVGNVFGAERASLATDGSFGPLTEGAVVEFQSHAGLEANGVVDSGTWQSLMTVAAQNNIIVVGLPQPVAAAPAPPPAPAVQQQPQTGQQAPGTVPILVRATNVGGVRVYVDNLFAGVTPSDSTQALEIWLAPGSRNLRLTRDRFEDRTAAVQINADTLRFIEHRFEMRSR